MDDVAAAPSEPDGEDDWPVLPLVCMHSAGDTEPRLPADLARTTSTSVYGRTA